MLIARQVHVNAVWLYLIVFIKRYFAWPTNQILGLVQIGCDDGARSRDHHEGEAVLSRLPGVHRPRAEVQCFVCTVRAAAVQAETLRFWTEEYSQRAQVRRRVILQKSGVHMNFVPPTTISCGI